MARGNGFLIVTALILTLIGGAVLGAVAGAGTSLYLLQRNNASRVVTVVQQPVSTSKPQQTQSVLPTAPVLPTPKPEANQQSATTSTTAAIAVPDVVAKVAPAVVTVINRLSTNNMMGQSASGSGSGAIISPDGYIITNHHVIDGNASLDVIFSDGTQRTAELVGDDPSMDLALIKVSGPIDAYLPIGDSDALRQGETVIAIGSPLGEFKNSVTVGVVSALNRNLGDNAPEGLIQTDAAINSGNSGGPLLNLRGEIIGINTLVVRGDTLNASAEGLGFAVPANIVRRVSDQLIATGQVLYPFLGVKYGMINADIAKQNQLSVQQGAYVTSVVDGGPVGKAGLQAGDIITSFEGIKLGQQASLRGVLLQYKPGDVVKLTVLRNNQTMEFTVTLGERPKSN
ncbi:MAG: PDZ domain-containing protein [Chloroflexia bacterium]|nr:PDZ domain-containing protein [Chloroflexia bacterium]